MMATAFITLIAFALYLNAMHNKEFNIFRKL
jgi:hypothetical protein